MTRPPENLYGLCPVHAAACEVGADGLVAVLVPRFENWLLRKLLVPLLRRPDFRVRFDPLGSFVWQQCDGKTTVVDIAARAAAKFGGDAEAMLHRTGAFLAKLARERVVTMRQPDATG